MSVPHKYRYPGVKPFESQEHDLFFGRDRDIEDLLDLVLLEKIVVLFGKSGYGKSSLINAGIIPRLKDITPVVVRLGSYIEGQNRTPLETLRLRISEVLADSPESDFMENVDFPASLWLLVKRKQSAGRRRFILIFDQFEEFFTYPPAEQKIFKDQLSELAYTEIPQHIRNSMESFSPEQQSFIALPFETKALFSIRSDRMSYLDSMKDSLPAILHRRYELRGLSPEQAREAIVRPARLEGTDFLSYPFEYSEEAVQKIIAGQRESEYSRKAYIEAFALQIQCQYVESKVIKQDIRGTVIEAKDLPDSANLYGAYYQRQIAALPPDEQETALRLIEEGLLFEDPSTGDARRLSVDADVLCARFGASKRLLEDLENTFLLRREANTLGGFNYEISHDTLVKPIQKSKTMHRAQQDRMENEHRRLEAEKKASEEMERRLAAEKQRKNARMLALSAFAGFFLVAAVGIWALGKKEEADQQKRIAEKALENFRVEEQ